MNSFTDIHQLRREIDSYIAGFHGSPLIIGLDSTQDYAALLGMLEDDPDVRIVRTSDECTSEYPPHPLYMMDRVSEMAHEKCVVWLGASQAVMFYGTEELRRFMINTAGSGFKGPVVLLCPYCVNALESIAYNYVKLGLNIAVMESGNKALPGICLYESEAACNYPGRAIGIRGMLAQLEDGKFGANKTIRVVTSCRAGRLDRATFPITAGTSAYGALCQSEAGFEAAVPESCGSAGDWNALMRALGEGTNLATFVEARLCPVKELQANFADLLGGRAEDRFLCFVALKYYCTDGKDYLAACLKKCGHADDILPRLYDTILDYAPGNAALASFLRQRRRLISAFDENSALMKDFCERATVFGKDILLYMSDATEEERAAIVHALSCYDYTDAELATYLGTASPELTLYLRRFGFDAFNTKLADADAAVRDKLTDYFERYKRQKLFNRIDDDFMEIVEQEASLRSFTKLQARSAIVKKLDRQGAQPYFFDALGAEFLGYIEAKAEAYGMLADIRIGHCNLPSITSKNKEFYDAFPEGSVLKEPEIDGIKHKGTRYDYRTTSEPLHIFEELKVLDRNLKKFASALAAEKVGRIILLSDHGASRLAVIYESENDRLVMPDPGEHSGRCCPVDEDPGIPFATCEDGFAVLANYERFKGGRKAEVETHGGATLEETIVPVIVLTAKPKQQQLYFPETMVKCSVKEGASIRLFANPPLQAPRMIVNDVSHDGVFDGDRHNVRFDLPEIRRKGIHDAAIYDGSVKLATLSFETVRKTGSNDIF